MSYIIKVAITKRLGLDFLMKFIMHCTHKYTVYHTTIDIQTLQILLPDLNKYHLRNIKDIAT